MKILARHVSLTVLLSMLGVLFLLLGLDLVFSFIGELEELKGRYQAPQAFAYVVLELPWRLSDVMPVAALVGAIAGLGMMANQSELTVMRASGINVGRIVWWAIRPALLLVAGTMLISQFLVPYCEMLAESTKSQALGQDYQPGILKGYWQKEDNSFVHVQTVFPRGRLEGVSFYDLDKTGSLTSFRHAESGHHLANGWQLKGVDAIIMQPGGQAVLSRSNAYFWNSRLTPEFLHIVTVSPEYLPVSDLYSYAAYLETQGLVSAIYYLEFWKKALSLLATVSMVLIACSFIFGPLRSVTMGLRIITGIMAGLGFRYLQDFSGYASLVYHFSPLIAVMLPILVCLSIGGVALTRVK